MQTFMPYPNYYMSLAILDNKRLGKQRVEAFQIIKTIQHGGGWKNHPAVKMWEKHIYSLMWYYDLAIDIWVGRGFKNNMTKSNVRQKLNFKRTNPPLWIYDERVNLSHKANLVRKDPEHYIFPNVEPFQGYYWPVEPKSKKAKIINEYWTRRLYENI